jgi:hypothetical protein
MPIVVKFAFVENTDLITGNKILSRAACSTLCDSIFKKLGVNFDPAKLQRSLIRKSRSQEKGQSDRRITFERASRVPTKLENEPELPLLDIWRIMRGEQPFPADPGKWFCSLSPLTNMPGQRIAPLTDDPADGKENRSPSPGTTQYLSRSLHPGDKVRRWSWLAKKWSPQTAEMKDETVHSIRLDNHGNILISFISGDQLSVGGQDNNESSLSRSVFRVLERNISKPEYYRDSAAVYTTIDMVEHYEDEWSLQDAHMDDIQNSHLSHELVTSLKDMMGQHQQCPAEPEKSLEDRADGDKEEETAKEVYSAVPSRKRRAYDPDDNTGKHDLFNTPFFVLP